MPLELYVGCRIFVCLSNKTNFTKNKFMEVSYDVSYISAIF